MNLLICTVAVTFIIGVALVLYILLDLTHAIMTDENPFNLREEDIELFDREDK